MKVCAKCKVAKSADDFARDASKRDDRQSYCRDCKSEYNREWVPAKERERSKLGRKIAKLEFLSENPGATPHEREVALRKARELTLRLFLSRRAA